jgi:hypothetical protein
MGTDEDFGDLELDPTAIDEALPQAPKKQPEPPSAGGQATVAAEGKRRSFDPALRQRISAEQARIDAGMQALRASVAGDLRLTKTGRVVVKGQPGSRAVFDALIARILSSDGAAQTQSDIRRDIQQRFPSNNVPKDWTVALPPWSITKLQATIRCSAGPTASIRVNRKTTLSSLHNEAKVAWQRHQVGALRISAELTITADTLTINDLPFTITKQRQNAKPQTYRYARVNIEKLLAACKLAPAPQH